jgi:Zn-dependent protease with chaperone function
MSPDSYRYPSEGLILALTILLVGAVVMLTALATVCGSLLFFGLFFIIAYSAGKAHQQELVRSATPVDATSLPELHAIAQSAAQRLRPGPVAYYLLRHRELNAYTFGLESPKTVVLYSSLLQAMDAGELRFIIGHELGHVALGHTWLNSIIGGMAGIPAPGPAGALLTMAFLWWNRACEYSADRAGLLACGSLSQATSALIKLAAGPTGAHDPEGMARAYAKIDAEDDSWEGGLQEAFATHPLLIRRINELRKWAATSQYTRLTAQ